MDSTKQQLFLEAYQACHEPFLRYCSALAYGKMDTEDLVQDVLLSAYQHFDRIQKKEQLLHYLIRAAKNKTISRWRKKRIMTELTDLHAERLKAQEVSAEKLLEIDFLYRMLDRLPIKLKEALILFEISGFSIKEIAQLQNSSEGAVKTMLSRGRKKLRSLMEEEPSSISLNNLFHTAKTILL